MGVDNGTLARRYMTELWTKGNLELIDELCADDIVLRDPMTPDTVSGKDTVRQRIKEMPTIFSDSSINIDEVIVSGDRVVLLTTWKGVHTGSFFGVKATGKTITCKSTEVLRIKNGKVVENMSYFDAYTLFQQMGALPAMDKLKPKEEAATSQTATA